MSTRTLVQRIVAGGVAVGVTLAGAVAAGTPTNAAPATASRIGGVDRYHTSALLAQAGFQPGVDTVFVASGESFPDALAAGAAAGQVGGPVLLTRRASLPEVIAAEVDRLNPARIVVVGGEASVSSDVAGALRDHAPTVERIAGDDRYETAALLSARYFGVNLVHVFLASGTQFPDALAAAAASRNLEAPVLLTAPDRLPAVTADELERVDANRIIVLGGSGAVSDRVFDEASDYLTEHVYREAGANRYETSARISKAAFHRADTVYLADGTQFPDALSAAPVAAASGPILLVTRDTLTTQVCQEVARLGATKVVALGGTGAVGDSVLNYIATRCAGDGSSTPAPTPQPTPTPTPTPQPPGVPQPGGETPPDQDITCASFQTQRQAQDYYDYWVGKGFGDHFKLDEDGDGTPCEKLPRD